MTTRDLAAARDRAVQMFRNFGRDEDADEFENMTLDEYADRKGIEVVNNPPTKRGEKKVMPRRRNPAERADALAEENQELRSKLDRIYGIAEAADSIDSEDGLRRSLSRIGDVLGIEDDDDDNQEDDSDDGDDSDDSDDSDDDGDDDDDDQ
jgi:hypothetical protein